MQGTTVEIKYNILEKLYMFRTLICPSSGVQGFLLLLPQYGVQQQVLWLRYGETGV
jgi:hypothetical protein